MSERFGCLRKLQNVQIYAEKSSKKRQKTTIAIENTQVFDHSYTT